MAMASIFLPFPPTSHHSLLLSTFLSPHPTTPRPLKRTTHCSLPRRPTTPHYIPNHIPDPSYVRILDTTLRDGEQSPGAAMTPNKKLDLARHLARLRVDVIEAGFPGASRGDFEAVKAIAEEVGNATVDDDGNVPVICAFSRCVKKDIDAAWDAVRHAKYPRINVFIATSDIHMQYKLQKSRDEVIGIAKEMISYAKSLGFQDIEFAAEDSGRADREFLCRILAEVIEAGASTVCIADTVGINIPCEFGDLIAHIKANTPGIENAIISVHCHDDLGLATSNTLAGAFAGARQLEVTVNGIGERAGNASLEEVVMAIKCRGKDRMGGLYTRINPKMIVMASKMVEEYTGMHVQPNKAIVGANAFAHESGIHQDGMLKHKATYEIISPEDVGLTRSCESRIRLGKLSGRHALRSKLLELGFELDDKELNDVFWRFKAEAEKTKHISDADLEALVSDGIFKPQAIWSLSDLKVTCGTLGSNATVKLIGVDGIEHVGSVVGTGPVHVAFKAIDSIVKKPVEIVDYSVTSVTEGINGMSSIRVVIGEENSHASSHATTGMAVYRNFSGTGAGTDIIVSSAQAYLDALNKMLSSTTYVNSQASSYTSAG